MAPPVDMGKNVAMNFIGEERAMLNGQRTAAMTVLVADWSPAFCLAASRFIAALPGYEVIGHPARPDEVMPACSRLNPDVLLMDFAFCGDVAGLDLVRNIKRRASAPRVILVAPVDDPAYGACGSRAGADGCIARDTLTAALPALMDRLCGLDPADPTRRPERPCAREDRGGHA